jgi:hypothetical protein
MKPKKSKKRIAEETLIGLDGIKIEEREMKNDTFPKVLKVKKQGKPIIIIAKIKKRNEWALLHSRDFLFFKTKKQAIEKAVEILE